MYIVTTTNAAFHTRFATYSYSYMYVAYLMRKAALVSSCYELKSLHVISYVHTINLCNKLAIAV